MHSSRQLGPTTRWTPLPALVTIFRTWRLRFWWYCSVTKVTVLVDLDGTLLDIRERHFRAHEIAAYRAQVDELPRSIYWRRKRAAWPTPRLLGVDQTTALIYDNAFRKVIEHPRLLALDVPIPGSRAWLASILHTGGSSIIVTSRQRQRAAEEQVRRLSFTCERLIVTPHDKASAVNRLSSEIAAWVGDTEADISAAKSVGVQDVAVLSGLRNKQVLTLAGASAIFGRVADIPTDFLFSDGIRTPLY